MVKDTISHDANKQLNDFPKFRDIDVDNNKAIDPHNSGDKIKSEYEDTNISERSIKKKTTSKYELSLDDIVEKIKKRLQSELSLMAATADAKITTEKSNEISKENVDKPIKSQSTVLGERSRYINPPSRYVKQTRNDLETKSREGEERERKFQQPLKNYVTQQSNYMFSQSESNQEKLKYAKRPAYHKEFTIQHNVDNKKQMNRSRNINQLKRIMSSTSGIFSAVNLALKDSYEDYVTPKKDQDYIEPETETTKPENGITNNYYSKKDQTEKKLLNIFSDEIETTTRTKEFINYEDETTNYNKRKTKQTNSNIESKKHKIIVENLPYKVAVNIGQEIHPFRENNEKNNFEEKENAGDNEQSAVEVSKAKGGPNRHYITSGVGKLKQINTLKINKRQSQNVVSPKRHDNNLVKIHKLNEKYNSDETRNEEQ